MEDDFIEQFKIIVKMEKKGIDEVVCVENFLDCLAMQTDLGFLKFFKVHLNKNMNLSSAIVLKNFCR